jgi:Protein of unknown function (DUF2846)
MVTSIHLMLRAFVRIAVIGLAVDLLAACSSVPSQTAATTSAPAPPRAGYAAVYIGRPFDNNTSIFSLPVEVDGKPLISLAPNQYTTVELAPGPHSIGVPDQAWTRAISGIPHPVEIAVESGKAYYLLPSRRYEDAGYKFTSVGAAVVPERTAVTHSSFSVQTAGANAAVPAEFSQLAYVKAP